MINLRLTDIAEGKEQDAPPEVEFEDLSCFDPDMCITPSRLRETQQKCRTEIGRSCILTPAELAGLIDVQRRIGLEDGQFGRDGQARLAEEEERSRRREGLGDLRRRIRDAERRARSDGDDARGALPADGRAPRLSNSLYAPPGGGIGLGGDGDDGDHESLFSRRVNLVHRVVEDKCFDCEDCSYVRKPDLARILRERNSPRIRLQNLLTSRRFHLYKHRFANCQMNHALHYPTLPQPGGDDGGGDGDATRTERRRTRPGHRFIITADTQFGILMDGFAMENPNWNDEIEISRRCVRTINAMRGPDRPLFVCVCGDLVDTESSFSHALASWKKVMSGWERGLVFEQQVRDFKRVWSKLDHDIALVCLCGNHDVGNRPTASSVGAWTSQFGDDYLAFWANGTYNVALNNCLFSDPTGAPGMFKEQLGWLEERLAYAKESGATHIFVYGHFPWFLSREDETDEETTSSSYAPEGWGPNGTRFPDNYFTIPIEYRQIAMELFKEYGVTACFSGHFHQNVVAKASWGMDMIVTGPLSMTLKSTKHESLSSEPVVVGMRIVDVNETGFTHKFVPLEDEQN